MKARRTTHGQKTGPKNPDRKSGNLVSAIDGGFPIVGIGASAGGLECFEKLFSLMADDTGMAFVLVSHLDPTHESMLSEIIQRTTKMPVVEASNNTRVLPNHVYVIPPNQAMSIFHGRLQLSTPTEPKGQRMLIDHFLRSLADEQGDKAICIILSGTGTDGTIGLQAVYKAGGVSFVQDPETAKYEGMPNSAVRSGLATYVSPLEKIPEQLTSYVKTFFRKGLRPATKVTPNAADLGRIILLIRSSTGNDFSLYKKTTIYRRIERRMAAQGINRMGLYVRYLEQNPREILLLFRELLINVTSFFRDPEAFEALKTDVFPQMFEGKPKDYVLRAWVPGCSSGEEAYSLAMALREYMDASKQELNVKIYGTDIDEASIATARTGVYPAVIAADVSPQRLKRFFSKEGANYRLKRDIREMVVFATQNVIKDPPFTKLDILSCRNLLIYLEPELQERLIPMFNYSLRPGGILFLSPSENIGKFSDLFSPVNRKWKVFRVRMGSQSKMAVMSQISPRMRRKVDGAPITQAEAANPANLTQIIQKELLHSYAPPSVVVDEGGDIVYVHGDTGKYLRPAPGSASLNVMEMAREGLELDLRTLLLNAAARKKQVSLEDVQVKTNGGVHGVGITVKPVGDNEGAEGLMIISFRDSAVRSKGGAARTRRDTGQAGSYRTKELEKQLMLAKRAMQNSNEEHDAFAEELKSTNEELQSTNEELQSTNEELETSKEELQSVNEELVTVNSELQAKIDQLSMIQNDLKNLVDSTNVGIIFLDNKLAIKRFTREVAALFFLVQSDIGRPLDEIKSKIETVNLLADAQTVLDTLVPKEREVQTTGHANYLVRTTPYRTLDNMIDGVVMTFVDISELKKAEMRAQDAREYAEDIVDTVREPLIVLDENLKIVSANKSFYSTFGFTPEETTGQHVYAIGHRQWDIPPLRELLETVLPKRKIVEDMVVEYKSPKAGPKRMILNARRIISTTGSIRLILLAIDEVTDGRNGV